MLNTTSCRQKTGGAKFFRAGPAGIRTTKAFSLQDCRWDRLDDTTKSQEGCIRTENAFSQEGGLAVLSRQYRG
ncbi:hypothetical protein OH492_01110 [Vibrio chagasii]|nr:hypothetical protein [Vibrio chagasii]